ncbi:MAG: Carbon monoxide dehydrogenase medium chain [Syntrophorhabdus sp. PtaU1.Bin002]|nr:MAG: Carbon monoxide dehydrogenase medium chain [Syntrophorhabdus sp. PtaB.Bin006]OPY68870.1 MAG: Carbon monoxide dehydrogenase medium chain [Syntrophorhabdus sp. PtaU1.Bin002]
MKGNVIEEDELSKYELHTPRNIKEAVELMSSIEEEAYYVSGGSKLIPLINQNKVAPKHLISLKEMPDLRGIKREKGLRLGSGATLFEVAHDEFVRRYYTALFDATNELGPREIRRVATLGGSICCAVPSMHLLCSLLLFDPDVAVAGMDPPTHQHGMTGVQGGFLYGRFMGIEKFVIDGEQPPLKKQEFVKEFVLPPVWEKTGSAYVKVSQKKAKDLGLLAAGARIRVSAGEDLSQSRNAFAGMNALSDVFSALENWKVKCEEVLILLGRPAAPPMRFRNAEDILKGNVISPKVFDDMIGSVLADIAPVTGITAEAWYRKEIAEILVSRALVKGIDRALWPDEKVRPESSW